jgi:hypothetical protein
MTDAPDNIWVTSGPGLVYPTWRDTAPRSDWPLADSYTHYRLATLPRPEDAARIAALEEANARLREENERLREALAAIAEDFVPDHPRDAGLALDEMRDAIRAALSTPTDAKGGPR